MDVAVSILSVLWLQNYMTIVGFLCGIGNMNLGLHACMVALYPLSHFLNHALLILTNILFTLSLVSQWINRLEQYCEFHFTVENYI